MALSNITGAPVSGADFYDRTAELGALTRALQAGNNVLLTAPRRVGKSSLVLAALDWATRRSWLSIQVDAQDCDTEASFLEKLIDSCRNAGVKLKLLDELAQKAKTLRRFLGGANVGAGGVTIGLPEQAPEDWRDAGRLFERLLEQLTSNGTRVAIGIDELPIFLGQLHKQPGGESRVDLVLRWLRALRGDSRGRVAWILCGSVGLDTFVEQHGLVGTINDLQLHQLGPFSDEVAVDFLMALGQSSAGRLPLNRDAADEILQCVGWPLPYYLQLMFHALSELPRDCRSPDYPSSADVRAAYQQLLQPHCFSYFAHWDTRLDDQLDAAPAATARFLLKEVSRASRGTGRSRLLGQLLRRSPHRDPESVERELDLLLGLLERDGYLMREKNTCAFRSFLLRDYWRRRFA